MGILSVFPQFYCNVEKGAAVEPGHLYWVPVPETDYVPRILEIRRADPQEHYATSFEIAQIASVHFSGREHLPIKSLDLRKTEELVISKAKKRPALVVATASAPDVSTLPSGPQRRSAEHLRNATYLMAPLYSVASQREPGTFMAQLVARIRALQYLHFSCLPDFEETGRPGQIVRLDRVFPSYLGRGCEPMYRRVHEEPFEVILSQFSMLTGAVYKEPYEMVKELVRDSLPMELRNC